MRRLLIAALLYSCSYASEAGLPGFDPAVDGMRPKPWIHPGSGPEPGVSPGYPGDDVYGGPHPVPDCTHQEMEIQNLLQLISELKRRLAQMSSLHLETAGCSGGLEIIRKAVSRYEQAGGRTLKFDGGRSSFSELFLEGYLEQIPFWFKDVIGSGQKLRCAEGVESLEEMGR